MIHEEFDKDITLESCAARLNYQPNYIWRVLKKEMNTTFSDYLAKYRLSIAKKWLEETSMPVGEIAEKLRYNNSQNFIRYFKKLEEITPGQYRDKFKNSANTVRSNQ
jgi:YesN/AraC family two-component response regulator